MYINLPPTLMSLDWILCIAWSHQVQIHRVSLDRLLLYTFRLFHPLSTSEVLLLRPKKLQSFCPDVSSLPIQESHAPVKPERPPSLG